MDYIEGLDRHCKVEKKEVAITLSSDELSSVDIAPSVPRTLVKTCNGSAAWISHKVNNIQSIKDMSSYSPRDGLYTH